MPIIHVSDIFPPFQAVTAEAPRAAMTRAAAAGAEATAAVVVMVAAVVDTAAVATEADMEVDTEARAFCTCGSHSPILHTFHTHLVRSSVTLRKK